MQRFYYKNKTNTGFLNLKSPLTDENYIQITKEEFAEYNEYAEKCKAKAKEILGIL